MSLINYSARSLKLKQNKVLLTIKYIVIFIFLSIVVFTFSLSTGNKNNLSLGEKFYAETYTENKNILKIENARLVGGGKNAIPYMITAKSAIKNNVQKDVLLLYSVEADITLKNNSWLFLSTEHASYNITEKVLSSNEKVQIFYDNGTSLETSNLNYKISSGLVEGNNDVVMFGKWGIIKSGRFAYDLNSQILKFYDSPVLKLY